MSNISTPLDIISDVKKTANPDIPKSSIVENISNKVSELKPLAEQISEPVVLQINVRQTFCQYNWTLGLSVVLLLFGIWWMYSNNLIQKLFKTNQLKINFNLFFIFKYTYSAERFFKFLTVNALNFSVSIETFDGLV